MTSRDRDMDLCQKCPLPDCQEGDPGCLRSHQKHKKKTDKADEEIRPLCRPWNIKETAERIGNSTDWIRKEIRKLKRGLPSSIPRFFLVGNRYRWDPTDVEAWLSSRKQGGAV